MGERDDLNFKRHSKNYWKRGENFFSKYKFIDNAWATNFLFCVSTFGKKWDLFFMASFSVKCSVKMQSCLSFELYNVTKQVFWKPISRSNFKARNN